MPQISVIIPVYNAEKYLNRCIDSILAQSFTDFEVLLVDDGSPDGSGEICDNYIAKDSRIRVFHKQNEGVSSARNMGLDNAIGEWVTFVDADDWIEKETLEQCIENSKDVEFVRFGMKSVYGENLYIEDTRLENSWTYKIYCANVFSRQTALGVCGGLYRRAIFTNNNIKFNPQYRLGEDWLVLMQYLKCIKKIKILNYPFYNYNKQNEISTTSTPSLTKFIELNKVASIICYDADLREVVDRNHIASLKANICAPCLANMLLTKSKLTDCKKVIKDMVDNDIFPSLKEIILCKLQVKFKLVLLIFSPIKYYQQLCML